MGIGLTVFGPPPVTEAMGCSSQPTSASAGGVAATLLTGFFSATRSGLVGDEWYGLPPVWIRALVVVPQFSPWVID